MPTYLLSRRVATFIVRLWVEPSAAGADEWRGEIEHVQTGEKRYFRDVSQLPAFIAAFVAAQSGKSLP